MQLCNFLSLLITSLHLTILSNYACRLYKLPNKRLVLINWSCKYGTTRNYINGKYKTRNSLYYILCSELKNLDPKVFFILCNIAIKSFPQKLQLLNARLKIDL